jgi:hypothetical protein
MPKSLKDEVYESMFPFLCAAVLGECGDGNGIVICKVHNPFVVGEDFWEWLLINYDKHAQLMVAEKTEYGMLISDKSNENFIFTNVEIGQKVMRQHFNVRIYY